MKVRIKLAEILEQRGISGREFARQTGIRHPTIHEMCRNESKSLPIENIAKICEVLDIQIPQLLELIEDRCYCGILPEEAGVCDVCLKEMADD